MTFRDDLDLAADWVDDYLRRVGELPVAAQVAPGQVRAETSMGVLLTLLAVPLALLSAKMLSVGRFGRAGM